MNKNIVQMRFMTYIVAFHEAQIPQYANPWKENSNAKQQTAGIV